MKPCILSDEAVKLQLVMAWHRKI